MENTEQPTSGNQHPMMAETHRHWMLVAGCWLLVVPQSVLIFAIRVYRLLISPAQAVLFGATDGCRFTPTCSVYALEAIGTHGALRGGALAAKRICRCQPWGGCGHDPVPMAESGKRKSGSILGHAH